MRQHKYFDFDLRRYRIEGARVELTKLQRAAGVQCEITVAGGPVAKAIRTLALENKTGLIVLGQRGKPAPFWAFKNARLSNHP